MFVSMYTYVKRTTEHIRLKLHIYIYYSLDELSLTSTPQMQIGSEYNDASGMNFRIFILIWVRGYEFISCYDKGESSKINKLALIMVNIACLYTHYTYKQSRI